MVALAADLQPGTIHDEIDRSIRQTLQIFTYIDCPVPPGQRRVVWHRNVQLHEPEERAHRSTAARPRLAPGVTLDMRGEIPM